MPWAPQGTLRGPQGLAGTGVVSSALNAVGELVLTYTNGSTINVGVVRGPQGPAGTSVDIRGSVATAADLPMSDPAIQTGNGFVVQDTGHLHIWDGVNTIWIDAGLIRGPKGDPGNDGNQGPRGTFWYTGSGAPAATPVGSRPGDLYLDTTTGDIYTLA